MQRDVDLVQALTRPLPVIVIAEMIGIPTGDRARFTAWSDQLVASLGMGLFTGIDPERLAKQRAIIRELRDYFLPLIEERRSEPREDLLSGLVAASVAEFRSRTEELVPELRTRAELDRIGREIWSRTVAETGLPVRAVHAAQSLGFLRGGEQGLFSSGAWLRLRTPYGSVAVRRAGLGALGLSVR